MKATTKVRLWRIKQTEKAVLYSFWPKGEQPEKTIWVPRSLHQHVSVDRHNPDEWAPCTVELPDWFVDRHEL